MKQHIDYKTQIEREMSDQTEDNRTKFSQEREERKKGLKKVRSELVLGRKVGRVYYL